MDHRTRRLAQRRRETMMLARSHSQLRASVSARHSASFPSYSSASTYDSPVLDLHFHGAQVHRHVHNFREVQQCTLLSIKTDGCSEDCSYETGVMSKDAVFVAENKAKEAASTRFCMGAAWRDTVGRKTNLNQTLGYIKGIRTSGLFLHHHQLPNDSFYAKQRPVFEYNRRYMSNSTVELRTDDNVVRFSFNNNVPPDNYKSVPPEKKWKRAKSSRKAKVNELRFYRLKAKKKMNSPNPEVRIRYKLEKAKRKEEWLLEKLRKYDVPKSPAEPYDPETLTEEEQHYLKRTGEKRKNFVLVGRRGVFGGVVLNMHLHWKKHETVKVICKPCNKPGQIHEYAEELARLSKGIVIDVKPNNAIVLYRGKNYVRPQVMSPVDTLSKDKALEKYRYEQSLEHTSEFIEKLEKELEEYHKYVARYNKKKDEETEKKNEVDSKSKVVV